MTLLLAIIGVALQAATITGEVKLTGERPSLVPVKVTKDQDYCGETLPNESYSIDAAGGLRNVVVFVEPAPLIAADAKKLNLIGNNGCR